MSIRARGSILFGFAVLLAVLFYFQPTTQAKEIFRTAIETEANEPQINQTSKQQSTLQTTLPVENQQKSNIESSETNASAKVSEGRAFRATAYCLQGRTANGGGVRRGIVAADPRVLPLGTRIQVTAGSYTGTYTVADTGGAVKGRVLDIWVPSCSEAIRFGRKSITVAVVGGRKSKSVS